MVWWRLRCVDCCDVMDIWWRHGWTCGVYSSGFSSHLQTTGDVKMCNLELLGNFRVRGVHPESARRRINEGDFWRNPIYRCVQRSCSGLKIPHSFSVVSRERWNATRPTHKTIVALFEFQGQGSRKPYSPLIFFYKPWQNLTIEVFAKISLKDGISRIKNPRTRHFSQKCIITQSDF